MPLDLEDKKGTSPDRYNFGPGIFFCLGLKTAKFKEEGEK